VREYLDDWETWDVYPQHRKWFNKLFLSQQLGYYCGPSGYAPRISNTYIVRPTYNLSGMSVGASIKYIESGDLTSVPPGYFWCEFFSGEHVSIDYTCTEGAQSPTMSWLGEKNAEDPLRFTRWVLTDKIIELPEPFLHMHDVPMMNAEYINGNLIEIHFRKSPDPLYKEFIPVWDDNTSILEEYLEQGYTFLDEEDDADGFLTTKRKGFLVHERNRIQ
jgi:hypothetical protein